jgi:hemerythrin superfamily protein
MAKKLAKRSKQNKESDIIDLILRDHKPLKALIKIMKSESASLAKKKKAFKEFAPTLIAHAKPEERTWYKEMKSEDMNTESIEGETEHRLAETLLKELKRTSDNDAFEAKAKVLAEMVEHHIEEEEEEMLPAYRRKSTKVDRIALALRYEEMREKY